MQVSLETSSGLERRLTIGIPADRIDTEVNARLQKAAKSVRLNGFRPGKVPMSVVRKRFGPGIRQEVLGEVMQSSFYEAVQKESLTPAGYPKIEPKSVEAGKDVEFVAVFEVYPQVELADFSQIEVEKLSSSVEEADIDKMIDLLRQQRKSWSEVDRVAANDDQVVIDFAGKIDGEAFEGGTSSDHSLVLGSKQMIEGFEAGLEGLKAGEEKALSLTFPDDYHSKDLAGKDVIFDVSVKKVSEATLPELDNEFFKQFGVESENVDDFRAEVTKNMERELAQAIRNKAKTQVMDSVLALYEELDVPEALCAQEINQLRQQSAQRFGLETATAEQLPDDLFKEQAQRRVKLGLIISEIVKVNNLKADKDRVRAFIEETAQTYQEPEEVINWYYSNQEQLAQVESVVLEDTVVDTLLENAKVTEKTVAYDEAVKPPSAAPQVAEENAEDSASE